MKFATGGHSEADSESQYITSGLDLVEDGIAAMALLILALLPSLALGDYIIRRPYYYTSGGPFSSCVCNESNIVEGAEYFSGGCHADTLTSLSSSLITCVNSTYINISRFTNAACSGTISNSEGSQGGCSCPYSYRDPESLMCVTSSSRLPSLSSLDSSLVRVDYSGKCPSTDPAVLPSMSAATILLTMGRRCSFGEWYEGLGVYGSTVCGAWGAVTAYYLDASCSSAPLFTEDVISYSDYKRINISTCSNEVTSNIPPSTITRVYFCTAPTAAKPDSMFSARMIPTCKGAINLTPLPTATLSCYEGVITSSGSNYSFVYPGGWMPSAPSVACFAATVSCSQQLVPEFWPYAYCDAPSTTLRIFGGASSTMLSSTDELGFLRSAAGMAPPRDLVMCTGNNCNSPSPAVDACAIISPPFTPLTCGAPPAIIAAPSPIACYSNLGSGSTLTPTLQNAAQPGALACFATTVNCPGTLSLIRSSPPSFDSHIFTAQVQKLCLGVTGAVRLYGDNGTLSIPPQNVLEGFFPPANPSRAYFNDLVVCTTPGCNNPATDTCALASAPVSVTASFSGLPDSAADATGKLTPAAVTLLTASLSSAVQSSACATCSVTVTKVVDTAKSTVVFNASRRRELALGALAVTFDVAGASTQTLAGVAAAATAPAFSQAAAKALAAKGGSAYASVAVSVAPTSTTTAGVAGVAGPALIGLVGLVGLLFVGAAVYFVCIKKSAGASKVGEPLPQQGMALPQQQGVVMRTQV